MIRTILLATVAATALAGSALAADLPYRKAPPVPVVSVPVFTWTGFYIGGEAGGAWDNLSANLYDVNGNFIDRVNSNNASGFVGGGFVGYNWQVASFVFGLEGNADFVGISRNANFVTNFNDGLHIRQNFEASIRGRLGYAVDRALFYVTGGVAFANFQTNFFDNAGFNSANFNTTRTGWTVGGGIEYAFTNNWTARVEYRYANFGNLNNDVVFPNLVASRDRVHLNENSVRAGIAYKFGGYDTPVVARY